MTSRTTIAAVVLGLAFGFGVGTLLLVKRPFSPARESQQAKAEPRTEAPPVVAPAPESLPPQENPDSLPGKPQAESVKTNGANKSQTGAAANPGAAKDPPATDQLARVLLSYVGLDPEAEEYWVDAINDPHVPADERQNLIEDLNEDGLSDPKHPTPDELPLILSRLRLIEQLAPEAMDQVNFEAFLEAYKDLLNLAELAQGRGEPVN